LITVSPKGGGGRIYALVRKKKKWHRDKKKSHSLPRLRQKRGKGLHYLLGKSHKNFTLRKTKKPG